jgi:8-oxo-dGTP diphosphatase
MSHLTVYLLLQDEARRLYLRRAGTSYGDGCWSLPSGHVKPGEGIVQAALRELREETGVTARGEDLVLSHVAHWPANDYTGFLFRVRHWQGTVSNTEPELCSELRWAEQIPLPCVSELPDMLKLADRAVYFHEKILDSDRIEA